MMYQRARRLALAVVAVVLATLVADLSIAPNPADAASGRRQSVQLALSSGDCTVEETETGSTMTTQVGAVVVNSPDALTILDGQLTLNLKNLGSDQSKGGTKRNLTGTWTFDPDGSPSELSGRLRGRRSGETADLRLWGRGRDALSGVSVKDISFSLPDLDDLCGGGMAFPAGQATIGYRQPTAPRGAVVVPSANSFDATVTGLRSAIVQSPLNIIAEVDHSAGAAGRGITLAPTFEFFFGNPAVGSPLMANADRTAGIDLPQKMVIWQDLFGDVYLAYNAPSYLQSRHQITDAALPQLNTVSGALANLASVATGTTVPPTFDAGTVNAGKGLVVVGSDQSADEAFSAIEAALVGAAPINVVFTLDHQANAAGVGVDLPATSLIVFGNPSLGSTLMQADQSVALDLPQKMLVFEDSDGDVSIAYNDPAWLSRRHGLRKSGPEVAAVLNLLDGALTNFSGAGA